MNSTPPAYEQALVYRTTDNRFSRDLELFRKRIGIVLFFPYFIHIIKSKHYEDYSEYLLDKIYEESHQDWPINLKNSLCGISWEIEYLEQQGFIGSNTEEISANINRKTMKIYFLCLSHLTVVIILYLNHYIKI